MKNKIYARTESILGTIFILWGILSLANAFSILGKYNDFLWLCYAGLFLIGIGLVIKNEPLVQSQLLILFIPDLFWTLDFIKYALTNSSFLGISDYYFAVSHPLTQLVSLQHLAIVPFAFYYFSKHRAPKGLAFSIGILQIITVFFLSRVFSSSEENLNCVYKFCGSLVFSEPYALWWFLLSFVQIALASICFSLYSRKK